MVLDVRLPGRSGLDFQEELNGTNIPLPVIFLTGHGDIPMSVRAMKELSNSLPSRFASKICWTPFSRRLTEIGALAPKTKSPGLCASASTLTPREQAVMTLAVSGLLNKQRAAEIGTSEATVKVHRANTMRKMQASSLADLVVIASKIGMPNPIARDRNQGNDSKPRYRFSSK